MPRCTPLALALALIASAGAAAPVTIQIVGGVPSTVVRVDARSGIAGSESRELMLSKGGQVRLELAGGETWRLTATAPGYWIEPIEITPDAQLTVTMSLWPAASLTAAVRPPAATKPPTMIDLRLTKAEKAPPTVQGLSNVVTSCPVRATGVLDCVVPAGRWDIRVKASEYVARYFWDRTLAANTGHVLGVIDLKPGSSIVARLVTEDGPADPKTARVTLVPSPQPNAGSVGVPKQPQSVVQSSNINELGYFQLDGVAPGSYAIQATQPGFASTAAIELAKQQDIELRDPIVMLRPLRLSLTIDPPSDPVQGAWHVLLMGIRNGNLETVTEGDASEDGQWLSPEVPAGRYTVQVKSRADSLAWETFQVSRETHDFAIELQLVAVRGRVQIGGEPFAADVWFGGRHGEQRVRAEAADDGTFDVLLPHDGKWEVDVEGRKRRVDARGVEVTVKPPRGGRPVEVSISLPSTLIQGVVRDTSMRPVEGATVTLVPLDGSGGVSAISTDVLGAFQAEGRAEGTYSVEARAGDKSSQREEIVVSESMAPPELELVLVERRQLAGRVTSWAGPVAGAWVLAIPMTARGGLAAMATPQARTDADGAFVVDLPPDAVRLRFIVTLPGYTLALKTVQLGDTVTAVGIVLDQVGGQLELERFSGEIPGGLLPIVMIDGQPTDLALLDLWSRAHEDVKSSPELLVVSALPPGNYEYCYLKPDEAMLVFAGGAYPSASACSSGQLSASGTLRLPRPRALQ